MTIQHVTWHDSCYCYMLILNRVGKSVCDGPGLCTWAYWWSTGCLAHVKKNVYKKNKKKHNLMFIKEHGMLQHAVCRLLERFVERVLV